MPDVFGALHDVLDLEGMLGRNIRFAELGIKLYLCLRIENAKL